MVAVEVDEECVAEVVDELEDDEGGGGNEGGRTVVCEVAGVDVLDGDVVECSVAVDGRSARHVNARAKAAM